MPFSIANHPDPTHGKPFPADRLVESRTRVDVWKVQRTLSGRDGDYMAGLARGRIQIDAGGVSRTVAVVEDEPMRGVRRLWWQCPGCKQRCRHLYLPECECRTCLHLDYSCRHLDQRGAIYRVRRFRRWLHVEETPFAEIVPPQRRGARWWRLVAKIEQEEAKLSGSLQRFVAAVAKESDK